MTSTPGNESLRMIEFGFAFTRTQEIWFVVAVVLILLGTALQWQLPRQRMSAEERMKDGKLTEEQANRKIRISTITAPVLTIGGCVLLIVALLGYLE